MAVIPPPATTLDHGRYVVGALLGAGGMSRVYRARDTVLNKDVAVKFIATEQIIPEAYADLLERFRQEAQALAQFSHPNLLKITDYGDVDGQPYFVTDLALGGTLASRGTTAAAREATDDVQGPTPAESDQTRATRKRTIVASNGARSARLTWRQAVEKLLPIVRALDYVHAHGVVHRDVKPANILLATDGTPILADFGIAKILQDDSATLRPTAPAVAGIGTPEYMAPEQVLGESTDARTDVYAMGVVLYELVTGRRPFQADTPMDVMVQQVRLPPPRPRRWAPGLSDEAERVLLRALSKRPQDRPVDMAFFAAELEASLRPSRVRRWAMRFLAVGGLTLLAAAAVAVSVWARERAFVELWVPALAGAPTAQRPAALILVPSLSPADLVLPAARETAAATEVLDQLDGTLTADLFPNESVVIQLVNAETGEASVARVEATTHAFSFKRLPRTLYAVSLVGAPLQVPQADLDLRASDQLSIVAGQGTLTLSAYRTDIRLLEARPLQPGSLQLRWRPYAFAHDDDWISRVDVRTADGVLAARAFVSAQLQQVTFPRDFYVEHLPQAGESVQIQVQILDRRTLSDAQPLTAAVGDSTLTWPELP